MPAPDPVWLHRVASATQQAPDTRTLVDDLLHVLQEITGLDSTYLTQIRWDRDIQQILQSVNAGEIQVPEGHVIEWGETLCRRAMAEPSEWVSDVQSRWPDSATAELLGLETYASTPVRVGRDSPEQPWGTLCGAARASIRLDENVHATMRLFAQLIADAVQRDEDAREQQEQLAQARSRLQQRTELTAAAEHAMKAPAATIQMWAETLTLRWDDLSEDTRKDGIRRIGGAADRLLGQISDLVREARAELMAGNLQVEPVRLRTEAEAVAERLGTENHTVKVIGEQVTVQTDRASVEMVLEHLVDNARAHTPAGTTITIDVDQDATHAVLIVRDDGPGLPDGVEIFSPFVRGNTDHAIGTGLGLHIVRSFTEALGGTVDATNDHGAVFTVRLPR